MPMRDQKIEHWINHINAFFSSNRGHFIAHDLSGESVILDWEKVDPQSPRINEVVREMSTILADTYTLMELQFARMYPERVIEEEFFLKSLVPVFEHGVERVDWERAKSILKDNFLQFFNTTDFAQFSKEDEMHIYVFARDAKTKSTLGIINFMVTPEVKSGGFKVYYFGLSEDAQNRGIGKMLMSSIYQLVPDTEKLLLRTRVSDRDLISLCKDWGFEEVSGLLQYWCDMEYLSDKSSILQKVAQAIQPLGADSL